MQAQFHFRSITPSDALREYAEERLGKIRRYFSDPIRVLGTFEVHKLDHVARFDVTLRNGLQLQASESTENMYSSIDLALAKMERQVRRYKDRIKHHKQHPGRSAKIRMRVLAERGLDEVAVPAEVAPEPTPAPEPAPEPAGPTIVREREFVAERLSVNQAIMQMNLLHNAFLVFTNSDTGDINVVYRRDDGDYGLIET